MIRIYCGFVISELNWTFTLFCLCLWGGTALHLLTSLSHIFLYLCIIMAATKCCFVLANVSEIYTVILTVLVYTDASGNASQTWPFIYSHTLASRSASKLWPTTLAFWYLGLQSCKSISCVDLWKALDLPATAFAPLTFSDRHACAVPATSVKSKPISSDLFHLATRLYPLSWTAVP